MGERRRVRESMLQSSAEKPQRLQNLSADKRKQVRRFSADAERNGSSRYFSSVREGGRMKVKQWNRGSRDRQPRRTLFRVDNYGNDNREETGLMDAAGKPLLTMKKKAAIFLSTDCDFKSTILIILI
ncbi:hypothetical protein EJ110_NYTH52832 [Nymphaea thermarum]|nr:hypothetical protein EJ110_NYTH52832 [Nymphaea thermarum]